MGISHSLPLGPHLIRGTHPLPLVQPHVHPGQSLGGGSSLFVGERSDTAGSSFFSGLLQRAVCGDEGLKVVETGHRPFTTKAEGSEDFLQDGDSLVSASFGSDWRLDGVSRLEGCVLASSDASGLPQDPQVRSVGEGVPVQGSLLWSVHGSAGLHMGHGSCFSFPSPIRHSSLSISRRLADPSVFLGAGSPCSGYSSPALSLAGNCRQLGEVAADSNSVDGLSGSSPGLLSLSGLLLPKRESISFSQLATYSCLAKSSQCHLG